MDEIKRIKEQIQMLHERLEMVEQSQAAQNNIELLKLSNEIANIKLAIYESRTKSTNN